MEPINKTVQVSSVWRGNIASARYKKTTKVTAARYTRWLSFFWPIHPHRLDRMYIPCLYIQRPRTAQSLLLLQQTLQARPMAC